MADDHRTITIKAVRDLKEGEHLFVEYDGFMSDQPLEVRRKTMWRWLDGPCMCSRCVREAREQLEKREAQANGPWGEGGKVDEKMEQTEEVHWKAHDNELPIL